MQKLSDVEEGEEDFAFEIQQRIRSALSERGRLSKAKRKAREGASLAEEKLAQAQADLISARTSLINAERAAEENEDILTQIWHLLPQKTLQ